uniref:NR LBD domain-containing protein n=1 Tax=Acrobeloides nanus TaxID=290746 RepID=A0A914C3E9_9BILA
MAKVFMHCTEYAELNFDEKILLHKHAVHLFLNIERFYTSIQYGCHENNQYCLLMYENAAFDMNSTTNIFQVEEFEKIGSSWKIYGGKMIKFLYKPMIELKLTQFELVYLLAQILWSTQEIKGLKSSTHDIANNMADKIATELHNYYINEKKLENYSPRLIKMLKLIDGSKSLLSELQNLTLITQACNIKMP